MDRASWVTGRRTTWGLVALTCLAVGAFVVSLVPGVRSRTGFDPVLDGWLQGGTYVLLALVALRSLVGDPANRRLRAGLVAALVLRAAGFVLFLAVVRRTLPPDYPSIADTAWLASSVLFVLGIAYVAWRQSPRATRTLVLDAVVGALVTAGIVASLLFDTLVALSRSSTAGARGGDQPDLPAPRRGAADRGRGTAGRGQLPGTRLTCGRWRSVPLEWPWSTASTSTRWWRAASAREVRWQPCRWRRPRSSPGRASG